MGIVVQESEPLEQERLRLRENRKVGGAEPQKGSQKKLHSRIAQELGPTSVLAEE